MKDKGNPDFDLFQKVIRIALVTIKEIK